MCKKNYSLQSKKTRHLIIDTKYHMFFCRIQKFYISFTNVTSFDKRLSITYLLFFLSNKEIAWFLNRMYSMKKVFTSWNSFTFSDNDRTTIMSQTINFLPKYVHCCSFSTGTNQQRVSVH